MREGRRLAGLLALGAAAAGVYLWWPAAPRDPPPLDGTRELVVFLGDSITSGHGLPLEVTFPQRLGAALGVPVRNAGISGATNAGLALAEGDYVGFLDHDDVLHPTALQWIVDLLQDHPELDVVYTDEDRLDPDGRRAWPSFKPDWSPAPPTWPPRTITPLWSMAITWPDEGASPPSVPDSITNWLVPKSMIAPEEPPPTPISPPASTTVEVS